MNNIWTICVVAASNHWRLVPPPPPPPPPPSRMILTYKICCVWSRVWDAIDDGPVNDRSDREGVVVRESMVVSWLQAWVTHGIWNAVMGRCRALYQLIESLWSVTFDLTLLWIRSDVTDADSSSNKNQPIQWPLVTSQHSGVDLFSVRLVFQLFIINRCVFFSLSSFFIL